MYRVGKMVMVKGRKKRKMKRIPCPSFESVGEETFRHT